MTSTMAENKNHSGCSMKILVEEEYGYRYWLWEVKNKTNDALETYFRDVIRPINDGYWYCTGVPSDHFIGAWTPLEWEEYKHLIDNEDYDGSAHIHEHHDSWIGFS